MNIFIAFAKEDLAVRDKLLRQMNLVANKQGWNIWSAKEIKAGERWDAEIKQRLMDSEVVILLLSMDFFNSKYIVETELPKVVEKHESGNCQIIPVIARVCHWKETTFGEYAELGDIQALPAWEKPIVSRGYWDNDDQPYFETVQGIRDSIKAFRTKSQAEQDAETQRARVIEQAEKDRIAALAAQREAEKEAESERLRSAESDRQRKEASERRTRSIEEQSNAYRRADQAHWEQAADDDTIEAYNTYLAQYPYPYGRMNSDAHLRIKELKKQNAAPIPWGRYVAIGGGLLALMLVLLWEYGGGSKNDEGTSSQPIIIDTVRRDMPDEFNKQDSVLLVPIQQSKQGLEATHIKKKKRQPTKPTKPDDSFGNEIDTIDKKSFFRRIFSQRAKPDSF